jgi:N utilization substance protein A
MSREEDVDAVGACIGTHGMRIGGIVEELKGEKIDIVKYSETPEEYVAAALAPAEVKSVTFTDDRACKVIVDSDQLSLAIGKEGQNARLAARLTGFKIDIKSE